MIWADYVIIAVIAVSTVIGLFRGFFREAVALAAWIMAFFVSFKFAKLLSEQLTPWIETGSIRLGLSYVSLFILVLMLGAVVNYFVGRIIKSSEFTGTDKMLGLGFGMVRGALIVVAMILLASITPDPTSEESAGEPFLPADPWWQESVLIGYFQPYAEWMRDLLPPNVANYFLFEPGPEPEKQPPPDPAAQMLKNIQSEAMRKAVSDMKTGEQ